MIPSWLRHCSDGLYCVPFHGVNLCVTVTKKGVDVDQWVTRILRAHRHCLDDLIVGLDIEWLPCHKEEKKNKNPAATLQLCVGQSCLIFQLLHKDYVPTALLNFLASSFTFVGVGVKDDADKLFRDHSLVVGGKVEDLRDLAKRVYPSKDFLRMGLKKIALEVLGREMEKPLQVTVSNWDAEELSFDQIKYGSIDAFASFQIGFNLFNHYCIASSQARPPIPPSSAIPTGFRPIPGPPLPLPSAIPTGFRPIPGPVPLPYWDPRCPSSLQRPGPLREHRAGNGCLQVA